MQSVVTITSAPSVSAIAVLRTRAVESEASVYGARRAYASGINDLPGVHVAWYQDGVELPASIKAEKTEYYKALKAIGYSNPSNAWKMVKQYAREDAIERGLFGEIPPELADGGEGGEGGEGETRETKTLTLRYVEHLTVLHKASMRKRDENSEEYNDKVRNAHHHLIQALKAMGVDVGA